MNICIAILMRSQTSTIGWYAPIFKLERNKYQELNWVFEGVWLTDNGITRSSSKNYFFHLPTLIKTASQLNVSFFIGEYLYRQNSINFHIDHLTNGYIDYSHLQIEEWHGENI